MIGFLSTFNNYFFVNQQSIRVHKMRPGKIIAGYAISLFFLLQISASARNDHIRFKRITINDGLSLSSVYSVYQDSKGFMWFGTEDGLNKYDGNNFTIYRPETGNINSLSYKWIELIYEDKNGNMWFGSRGGLSMLDPVYGQFIRYGNKYPSRKISNDTITCIEQGTDGLLWVGTSSGINGVDATTNRVIHLGLEELNINVIRALEGGAVLVGTNQGLYYWKDEEFSRMPIDASQGTTSDVVSAIVQESSGSVLVAVGNKIYRTISDDGLQKWNCILDPSRYGILIQQVERMAVDNSTIWISTEKGLFKFDHGQGRLLEVLKSRDLSHSLAINSSRSLYLDNDNYLWYGTFGEGIYRIDLRTGRFDNFRHNPAELSSLSENAINCIAEDGSGNIWIGTFGAGINIYYPHMHKFEYMSHQSLNENSLSSNFIWSIMECDNELLWVGTNDAGLNIYDPVRDRYRHFMHDPSNARSLSNSSVRKVYQDSKKRIWVGTDGGGLNRFFPSSGTFAHYQHAPSDPTSISDNSVRVIYEDRDGRLWVGTRNGLNEFDPDRGTFKRYQHAEDDPNSMSNNFVYSSIYQDENGYLWIGTYGGGLNRMEIETGKFEHFMHDPNDSSSISDDIVFSIFEDTNGIFWVGTNSGLNRFDRSTGNFEKFGIPEGLPNEVIYGILPGAKNQLWLSTNHGLCRFSLNDYSVKNFNAGDGLQSNEFNGGAFHKGQSGRLFFGGVYGLNIVDPELNYIDENYSKVVFTRLEILGSEVAILKDSLAKNNKVKIKDGEYFLSRDISYSEEVFLDYKHRFFSIEFAALNSSAESNLTYQYLLQGLEDSWKDAGKRNFITFANMPSGAYNLKVRTQNPDGLWSISDASLHIVISPPFWHTWWFYLIEVVVVIMLATFIYRYLLKIRTNRLLKIQNEQINLANEQLQISEQNLKRLNATKDKFFSIISHDLKNPFTSLLSISELMAKDYDDMDEEDKEQGIGKVHESATRIYKLLENLLTWSRTQSGNITYKPGGFDISSVVNENMSLFAEMAEKKGIRVMVNIPAEARVYADYEMINTVLRNLLGNALKFSSRGDQVTICAEKIDASWKVSIKDQGIGISNENREKIFRIDTKIKTEGTAGEKGTGLGLIISKEFVEKNKGYIEVVSEEGNGSIFSFTVPVAGKFVQ